MAVDLSVEFCGVKFKNPFVLSASPASTAEKLKKAAKAGWGGAVVWTKEIMAEGHEAGHSLPHGVTYIDKPPSFWSIQTCSVVTKVNFDDLCPVEKVERVVRKAKESGIPIITNILASLDFDKCVKASIAAEKAGADIIEVNPSYALLPGAGMHLGFARDLNKTRELARAVKQKTSIPVMVKLNAFLIRQELMDWAKACVEGGADAISLTNSIPGIAGIDVETGRPLSALADEGGRLVGRITIVDGPAIRPIGLAGLAAVRSAVDVPLAAIGGVTDWHSAVEYMMAGASIVQVGSAAMAYGYGLAQDLIRGLEDFMKRKKYETIGDFVGITYKRHYLGAPVWHTGLMDKQPFKMVVDKSKCNGCERCEVACEASAEGAMRMEEGVARIDQDLCWGCRMCMLVCPEGAIATVWEPAYAE